MNPLSRRLSGPKPSAGATTLVETLPVVVSAHPHAPLHNPATIRARCAGVLNAVEQGVSPSFKLKRDALPPLADRVAALTRQRFPDLVVPLHSRWRQLETGGASRKDELNRRLEGRLPAEVARVQVDMIVISCLLSGGAGANWIYSESAALSAAALPAAAPEDLLALLDQAAARRPTPALEEPAVEKPALASPGAPAATFRQAEGLAVASFRAFMAGAFSSQAGDPQRADASALRHVDAAALRAIFQSSPSNPVVGLDARAAMLARLGHALQEEAARDTARGWPAQARPGLLFDRITGYGTRHEVSATEVLGHVLRVFLSVWPSGSKVQGLPAGDVWPHLWAGSAVAGPQQDRTTEGWVPFHQLAQWITCSLLEPLTWAGIRVTGVEALTALPDARNAGLLIDAGVIVPRDPRLLARTWKPQDELVIEWRAMAVVLLDELAVLVRQRLGLSAEQLPMPCFMEGGSAAAGVEWARSLRPDGTPPVSVEGDGILV